MTTDSGVRADSSHDTPGTPAPPPAAAPGEDPATSFTPQPATRWLTPGLLLRSAGEVVVSGLMGEYNDKRELMGSLEADEPLDLRTDRAEVWVDYVSDTGDGFDATYAVASVLATEELVVAPQGGEEFPTERGRLLVMGGDQCYPSADVQTYEDRLIGPFRAALRDVKPESAAPELLAVPGNHDWYDGLTAFMRTFCQRRWIGGWHTRQSRSYFVVKLPGRWWLWGIDIQFDTYIDDIQRRYFEQAAEDLQEGDAVILCSAKPSWVSTAEDDLEAYTTLDFVDRTLIRPSGARLRVCLSGDRHHYVRYEAEDGGQRITAGGGGAYLTPTHHLPEKVAVPPAESRARSKTDPVPFERRAVYPDARESRKLAWGVLKLPWQTWRFAALLGGVHTLLALAMLWTLGPELQSFPDRLRSTADALAAATPARLAAGLADSLANVVLAGAVVGAALAFTKKPGTWRGMVSGTVHGVLHLLLAVWLTYGVATVVTPLPGSWMLLAFVPLVFLAAGLVASELVAVYLLLADRWKLNTNELYAAQAIPHHKNFLRLHVDPKGDLRVYPVGLPQVPRRWKVSAGPPGDRHRFLPDGESPSPFLIERPVVVSPDPVPSSPVPHPSRDQE